MQSPELQSPLTYDSWSPEFPDVYGLIMHACGNARPVPASWDGLLSSNSKWAFIFLKIRYFVNSIVNIIWYYGNPCVLFYLTFFGGGVVDEGSGTMLLLLVFITSAHCVSVSSPIPWACSFQQRIIKAFKVQHHFNKVPDPWPAFEMKHWELIWSLSCISSNEKAFNSKH